MSDRYAVFGNPVAHSQSPLIHQQFAEQTRQDLCYEAQLVEPGGFGQAASEFFAGGGKGLNVTVPFKLDAYSFAAELSGRAELAGAVNTLYCNERGLACGDNTDGVGLVRDITVNLKWQLAQKTILLLGAGGAARGVIGPLLEQGPAQLLIANRTEAKAAELCSIFSQAPGQAATALQHSGLGLPAVPFDIVINATSASLGSELPGINPGAVRGALCYDMMYSADATAFQTWCRKQEAAASVDGLGMLVEQAAESFYIWRKVRPVTGPVIAQVRARL